MGAHGNEWLARTKEHRKQEKVQYENETKPMAKCDILLFPTCSLFRFFFNVFVSLLLHAPYYTYTWHYLTCFRDFNSHRLCSDLQIKINVSFLISFFQNQMIWVMLSTFIVYSRAAFIECQLLYYWFLNVFILKIFIGDTLRLWLMPT